MTGRQLQKLLILNLPYAFLGLLATKLRGVAICRGQ